MESWKITNKILLLKEMKYREELDEAQQMLDIVDEMDYNALKAKAAQRKASQIAKWNRFTFNATAGPSTSKARESNIN